MHTWGAGREYELAKYVVSDPTREIRVGHCAQRQGVQYTHGGLGMRMREPST